MFELDGRATYPAEITAGRRDAAFAESRQDRLPFAWADGISPTAAPCAICWSQQPVSFTAVRYQGSTATGHHYLRYAQPRAFGDVSDEERQKYGAVLERYYAYIDGEIGAAIERLAPGDLLLVVSGFGMEPVGPHQASPGRA